jgi:hypothetical protein
MNGLHPCPTCSTSEHVYWEGPDDDCRIIRCGMCGLEGPQAELMDAVDLWADMAERMIAAGVKA